MTRRERWHLGLVLAVALALRLALWAALPRENLVSDEPEYLAAASWLAQGRGFSFYDGWPWLRPPLYLLFLAPLLRSFGLDLAPIRLVQVLVSLTVPALVSMLARRALGPRAALVAGLVAALWLPLAILPHLVLAENLFLPLLLGGFLALAHWQTKERPIWALAGGVLLGLATLTRGLTVAFLPPAALWTGAVAWRKRPATAPGGAAVWPALLVLAGALGVILPWSGYNTLRYGRPILVDTTGGYNFWLGTQGGQFHNLPQVNRLLLAQPDPAARQAYAYEQGLGAIRAEPLAFLRNRITEAGQLARINYGADERLVDGFVLGAVSAPHLLALLVLEDTLYVLLVPAAVFGLFLRRGETGRGLVLLWLGYNVLLAVAFFAISRFRLPLLPFLAIYAAALAEHPWRQEVPATFPVRGRRLRLAAAGLLSLGFWALVLPSYLGPYPAAWGATLLGLEGHAAAVHLARAEGALAAGDRATARQEIEAALAYRPDGMHPAPTAQVVLAAWQRAGGNEEAALETLVGLDWYQAALLRGDLFRAHGDLPAARAEWSGRDLLERNPTAWAWDHLQAPPGREVDLGGGLDWGLVDGFYGAEKEGERTYRWSAGTARLRFPQAGTGRPLTLLLSLRGWRPEGEAPAEVEVVMEGTIVARLTAPADWGEHEVHLPSVPAGQDVVVTLRTTTFLPAPSDLLSTGCLRTLGVMVDAARVQ